MADIAKVAKVTGWLVVLGGTMYAVGIVIGKIKEEVAEEMGEG